MPIEKKEDVKCGGDPDVGGIPVDECHINVLSLVTQMQRSTLYGLYVPPGLF